MLQLTLKEYTNAWGVEVFEGSQTFVSEVCENKLDALELIAAFLDGAIKHELDKRGRNAPAL